jgi:hypothetical protein
MSWPIYMHGMHHDDLLWAAMVAEMHYDTRLQLGTTLKIHMLCAACL